MTDTLNVVTVGCSGQSLGSRQSEHVGAHYARRLASPLPSRQLDAGRRRSRLWVAQELADGRLDDFGAAYFKWIADAGLAMSEAAELLGLETKRLRQLTCSWLRQKSRVDLGIQRDTMTDLATRLGADGAW